MPLSLPQAWHDTFFGQDCDLSNGDKIILHAQVLARIMDVCGEDMPQPCMFSIVNPAGRRKSHCGVLEYTSDDPAKAVRLDRHP